MTEQYQFAWQVLGKFLADRCRTTSPKFPPGIEVILNWTDEDDQRRSDRGFIVGFFPAPCGFLPGWWYVVSFTDTHNWDWMPSPFYEEAHESELELAPQDSRYP